MLPVSNASFVAFLWKQDKHTQKMYSPRACIHWVSKMYLSGLRVYFCVSAFPGSDLSLTTSPEHVGCGVRAYAQLPPVDFKLITSNTHLRLPHSASKIPRVSVLKRIHREPPLGCEPRTFT